MDREIGGRTEKNKGSIILRAEKERKREGKKVGNGIIGMYKAEREKK